MFLQSSSGILSPNAKSLVKLSRRMAGFRISKWPISSSISVAGNTNKPCTSSRVALADQEKLSLLKGHKLGFRFSLNRHSQWPETKTLSLPCDPSCIRQATHIQTNIAFNVQINDSDWRVKQVCLTIYCNRGTLLEDEYYDCDRTEDSK